MKLINMCVYTGSSRDQRPLGVCMYSEPMGNNSIAYLLIEYKVVIARAYSTQACIETGSYRLATKEDNQIIKEYYK